jgi:DHA2 family metal-tetracycline-proton antiporter-like MFS transporter
MPKDWKIGTLVRRFVLLDLLLWGGWGLITPILAVFILKDIEETTILTVGITSAIYWLVNAITQLVSAGFIDEQRGEQDDARVLAVGLFLGSLAAFSFLLVENTWHLFLVAALQGVAFGLYSPAWTAIFSRHLDDGHYALDWSLDRTSIAVFSAITAVAGGAIAEFFGFDMIFGLAGVLSFLSCVVVLRLPKELLLTNDRKSE